MYNYSIFLYYESQVKYLLLIKMPEGLLLSSDTGQPTGREAAVMNFCHLIQMHPQGSPQTSLHPF